MIFFRPTQASDDIFIYVSSKSFTPFSFYSSFHLPFFLFYSFLYLPLFLFYSSLPLPLSLFILRSIYPFFFFYYYLPLSRFILLSIYPFFPFYSSLHLPLLHFILLSIQPSPFSFYSSLHLAYPFLILFISTSTVHPSSIYQGISSPFYHRICHSSSFLYQIIYSPTIFSFLFSIGDPSDCNDISWLCVPKDSVIFLKLVLPRSV